MHTFPSGASWPYAITTIVSDPTNLIIGALAVNRTNELIAEIAAQTNIAPSLFSGPSWVNGSAIDILTAYDLLVTPSAVVAPCTPSRKRYVMVVRCVDWRQEGFAPRPTFPVQEPASEPHLHHQCNESQPCSGGFLHRSRHALGPSRCCYDNVSVAYVTCACRHVSVYAGENGDAFITTVRNLIEK